MKSSQFCTRFSLVIAILSALSKSTNAGFAERPEPEEPVLMCAIPGCCFGPTPIPSDAQLEIYVLSYESVNDATLGTSATRAEAVAPLAQDYLEEDIVTTIANLADSYGFAPSTLVSSLPNACEIPIEKACKLQVCGCPDIPIGRRLLQCFPVWGCQISSTAPIMDGSDFMEGEEDMVVELVVPNTAVVAICLVGSCSIFRLAPNPSRDFIFAFESQCPNLDPLPAVASAVSSPLSPTPSISAPSVESPEPSPAPSPEPSPAPETLSRSSRRRRRRKPLSGDISSELSSLSFSGGNGRPLLLPGQTADLVQLARNGSMGLLPPVNATGRANVLGGVTSTIADKLRQRGL